MDINLQAGPPVPQLPSARSADTPVVKTDSPDARSMPAPKAPTPQPATNTITDAEERRYQQVVQAAQSFFKDVYAVSDTTFTIFKDSTGQYITRFTSLRDGSVTYIPEPKMLQYAQRHIPVRESVVGITA